MWDEKPEIMYNYEINLTEKEQTTLLQYSLDNITKEAKDALLIEWAILCLLKEELKNNS